MAMEIKTLEIKNSEEQKTIEFWTQFGWQLKSSQRIYNKDSHLAQRGDTVYSVTETVDFTKLVFERDKNGPNYSTIARLEREYLSIDPGYCPDSKAIDPINTWAQKAQKAKKDLRPGKKHTVFTRGGVILGVALLLGFEYTPIGSFGTVLQLLGVALIIASLVWNRISKKKYWEKALNGSNPKCAEQLKLAYDAYVADCSHLNNRRKEWDEKVRRQEQILAELSNLV